MCYISSTFGMFSSFDSCSGDVLRVLCFLRFFVGDDGGQTSRGGEMSAPIPQPEFL